MSHEVRCNNDFHIITHNFILPTISSLAVISMIYPIFIYCHAYWRGDLKSTKFLFYAGLILFMLGFLAFIAMTIRYPIEIECNNYDIWWIMFATETFSYLQTLYCC